MRRKNNANAIGKKTPSVAKERTRRCRLDEALLCGRVQFERVCRRERTGVRDQRRTLSKLNIGGSFARPGQIRSSGRGVPE